VPPDREVTGQLTVESRPVTTAVGAAGSGTDWLAAVLWPLPSEGKEIS